MQIGLQLGVSEGKIISQLPPHILDRWVPDTQASPSYPALFQLDSQTTSPAIHNHYMLPLGHVDLQGCSLSY